MTNMIKIIIRNRIRRMLTFLSSVKKKDVSSSCHEHGTKKTKILPSHEELNLRSSDFALRCSTTVLKRLYSEQGSLRSSYMTHVLCRISNVDSVMFVKRVRKLVHFFQLGKEIAKHVFFVDNADKRN